MSDTTSGIANQPIAGVFGTALNIAAITDLADLSVDGFTMGTMVWVREAAEFFNLQVSSEVVDHTTVEAVNGYDDLRWLVFTTGGGDITLTGDVTGTEVDGEIATTVENVPAGAALAASVAFTATDKLLGRSTSGAGNGEEITCTATGRSIIDDASVSAVRQTLLINGLAPNQGSNIADSSATVQPGTDSAGMYTLPAATLSANRTTTIGVTSATTNMLLRMVRRDRTGNTWAIANGGTNGGTLFTFPATPTVDSCVDLFYNGVDWVLVGFTWLAGTA